MTTTTKLITYEDSLTMPENKLEEIVEGESRIMPPPTEAHWDLLSYLAEILREQLPRREFVVETGPVGLGIKRHPVLTYRIPDLTVFTRSALAEGKREKEGRDPYIWKRPELLVECLSPSNRKGPVEKLVSDYESIGVPEFWLIDPRNEVVSVYRFDDDRLLQIEQLQRGALQLLRLPSVTVDIGTLWKISDF